MKGSSRIAVAIAAGYVLGRRHKLRTAVLLAGAAASGRLSSLGGAAVKRGATIAGSSKLAEKIAPQLGGIASTVRGELANAGKAAAMTLVNSRIESLTETLHQRTEALRGDATRSSGEWPDEDESPDRDSDGRDEPEDRAGTDDSDEPVDEPNGEDEDGDSGEPEGSLPEDEEAPDDEERAGDEDDDEGRLGKRRPGKLGRSPVSRTGR